MEFRKGILFIRLNGILTKNTVAKLETEVTQLVKENGIRNIVFNIEELEEIDTKGFQALLYNYELCKKNHGQSLLCGAYQDKVKQKMKKVSIPKDMGEIHSELAAFQIINL